MSDKVYIILLNFNGWKDTIECAESVLKSEYENFQLVIVDNSSNDDDVNNILSWAKGELVDFETKFENLVYPLSAKPVTFDYYKEEKLNSLGSTNSKVVIIKALENEGFAAGNNIAINYLQDTYQERFLVWLLNNDTVICSNALGCLIRRYNNNKSIGILGSRLMYYDKPEIVQALGGVYSCWWSTTRHIRDGFQYKREDKIRETPDYIVGASMMTDSVFLDKVGLMYEKYFLYYEEIDWALRAKSMGYEIDVCLESVVYHKEGGSISKGDISKKSSLADYCSIRNRLFFTSKFFPLHYPIVWLSVLAAIFNRIRRKQFNRVRSIVLLMVGVDIPYKRFRAQIGNLMNSK